MKNIKWLVAKIFKLNIKNSSKNLSIMSQKAYNDGDIPIDKISIPYGQSILSMNRYNPK